MVRLKRPGRKKTTSPRVVQAQLKATEAIQLRIGGARYHQIADALGYNSPQAAQAAVVNLLRKMAQEPTEELRRLEIERLDSLFFTAFPLAKQGVLGAIDRCLKIMERRARLLGLDAPERFLVDWREQARELGIPDSEAVSVFQEMVNDFAARLGGGDGGERGK